MSEQKMTTVDVTVNKSFMNAIGNVSAVSKNVIIKKFPDDRVGLVQQSKGGEIIINLTAPLTSFNYDKQVAIKNFPAFQKTLDIIEDVKFSIKENAEGTPVSIILSDKELDVEFSLEKTSAIRSGKTVLPTLDDNLYTQLVITEDELKELKSLISALIADKAENGTRLNATYDSVDNELLLKFNAVKAIGNSFTKKMTPETQASDNFNLTFDPLFFTWLPSGDYTLNISNGTKKFIQATMTDSNKDTEVATYVFTAGLLK